MNLSSSACWISFDSCKNHVTDILRTDEEVFRAVKVQSHTKNTELSLAGPSKSKFLVPSSVPHCFSTQMSHVKTEGEKHL